MSYGTVIIIFPFIAAWITDTFAYFSGRFFGKHKLSPLISPNKTIEGSIGGILGCILAVIAYKYIAQIIWGLSLDIIYSIAVIIPASIIAQIGDLSFSYLKREFKIKDFGTILPGHGGILDRFDSLLFAAPFVEILFNIFG